MTRTEFFPPTKEELKEIIAKLEAMLEDERYSEEWQTLAEQLKEKRQQLKELEKK